MSSYSITFLISSFVVSFLLTLKRTPSTNTILRPSLILSMLWSGKNITKPENWIPGTNAPLDSCEQSFRLSRQCTEKEEENWRKSVYSGHKGKKKGGTNLRSLSPPLPAPHSIRRGGIHILLTPFNNYYFFSHYY